MVRAVSQAWHRLCSSWEETQYFHLLTQCMPKTKPDGSGEKAFKQPQRIVWNYWVTPSRGCPPSGTEHHFNLKPQDLLPISVHSFLQGYVCGSVLLHTLADPKDGVLPTKSQCSESSFGVFPCLDLLLGRPAAHPQCGPSCWPLIGIYSVLF